MANLGKCIIFCCGAYGQQTFEKLSPFYDIIAFCDNNSALYGSFIKNTPIVSIEQMLEYSKLGAIIVVSNQRKYRQVAVQLRRLGIDKVYVMNDGFSYLYGDGEMYPVSLLPQNDYYKKKSANNFSVLYVQYYPNIRTARIAQAVKKLGCEVAVAYYSGKHHKGTMDVFGENVFCFSTFKELIDWIDNSEFDIVQTANRNLETLLNYCNKKLILDIQDLHSFTANLLSTALCIEFIENAYSDGLIYTNKTVRDIAAEKYGLDARKTLVVENFPLSSCRVAQRYKKLSQIDGQIHIVYEGDIISSVSRERDFTSYWKKCAEAGVHIHFYSARIGYPELEQLAETNPYIHYEGNLSSEELALEMTKYDCGWMMFNTEVGIAKIHLDNCSTNKLFEYLNSGLPVIIGDSKCHLEFVEKYNCGGALDLDGDIVPQLKQISSLIIPDDFVEKNGFVMEKQANDILGFYKRIASDGFA